MSDQFKEEKIDTEDLDEVTGGIGEAEGSAIDLAEVSISKCPACGTSWVKKQVKTSSGNPGRPTQK